MPLLYKHFCIHKLSGLDAYFSYRCTHIEPSMNAFGFLAVLVCGKSVQNLGQQRLWSPLSIADAWLERTFSDTDLGLLPNQIRCSSTGSASRKNVAV